MNTHGDVVCKLSAVDDMFLLFGVEDITHGHLSAFFVRDAGGDLDLQAKTLAFRNVAALEIECAVGNVL